MKLKALTAALFLSAGLMQANAQTVPHIGLVTGYNTTWLLDQKLMDDQNYDARTTWNSAPFGVVLGYKLNPSSSFQIEIFKSNMGAEYDIMGRESILSSENKKVVGEKVIATKYTSVPVLYKFTAGEKVRFNFHFGPQFNFLSEGTETNTFTEDALLKANITSVDISADDEKAHPGPVADFAIYKAGFSETRASKEDFNKTDIGAALGLGLEADIVSNLYLSANIRFYYGFKDIRSEARVTAAESRGYYDSRNNVTGGFQIGLHYRFSL